LNESGGLISNKPGFVGPHFGCGLGASDNPGQIIGDGTIENKLQCVLGFFQRNSIDTPAEADAALKTYGYANGTRQDNLVKIIGYLGGSSTLNCGEAGAATTNPYGQPF